VCVLLVTKNILLGDVLENLLTNIFSPRRYQILRPSAHDLSANIHTYHPDVVVLEAGLLGELSLWSRQQLHTGRVRIILVDPQNNRVQVCDQLPITLTQISDFTALFENMAAYTPLP